MQVDEKRKRAIFIMSEVLSQTLNRNSREVILQSIEALLDADLSDPVFDILLDVCESSIDRSLDQI